MSYYFCLINFVGYGPPEVHRFLLLLYWSRMGIFVCDFCGGGATYIKDSSCHIKLSLSLIIS